MIYTISQHKVNTQCLSEYSKSLREVKNNRQKNNLSNIIKKGLNSLHLPYGVTRTSPTFNLKGSKAKAGKLSPHSTATTKNPQSAAGPVSEHINHSRTAVWTTRPKKQSIGTKPLFTLDTRDIYSKSQTSDNINVFYRNFNPLFAATTLLPQPAHSRRQAAAKGKVEQQTTANELAFSSFNQTNIQLLTSPFVLHTYSKVRSRILRKLFLAHFTLRNKATKELLTSPKIPSFQQSLLIKEAELQGVGSEVCTSCKLFSGVLLFSREDLAFINLRSLLSSLLKALHVCLFASLNNKRIIFVGDPQPLVQEHHQRLLSCFIGSQVKAFTTTMTELLPPLPPSLGLSSAEFNLSSPSKGLNQSTRNFYNSKICSYRLADLATAGISCGKWSANFIEQNLHSQTASQAEGYSPFGSQQSTEETKHSIFSNLHALLKNAVTNEVRPQNTSQLDFEQATFYTRTDESEKEPLYTAVLPENSYTEKPSFNSQGFFAEKQKPLARTTANKAPNLHNGEKQPLSQRLRQKVDKAALKTNLTFRFKLENSPALTNKKSASLIEKTTAAKARPQVSSRSVDHGTQPGASAYFLEQKLRHDVNESNQTSHEYFFYTGMAKLVSKAAIRNSLWTASLAQPSNYWIGGFFSNNLATYKQKLSSTTLLNIKMDPESQLQDLQDLYNKNRVRNVGDSGSLLQRDPGRSHFSDPSPVICEIKKTDRPQSANVNEQSSQTPLYVKPALRTFHKTQSYVARSQVAARVSRSRVSNEAIKQGNVVGGETVNSAFVDSGLGAVTKTGELFFDQSFLSASTNSKRLLYSVGDFSAGLWSAVYAPVTRKNMVDNLEEISGNYYQRKQLLKSFRSLIPAKLKHFKKRKGRFHKKVISHCLHSIDANKTTNAWLKEADLVFFANPEKTLSLLNQINRLKIPTIGILNSGSNLAFPFRSVKGSSLLSTKPTIDYPIIGNSNSLNFLRIVLTKFACVLNKKRV